MTLKEILADPNISYWLKEAVKTASGVWTFRVGFIDNN
jgi:hypothetical protein